MVLHPLDPVNPYDPPFMFREGRARIGLRLASDDQWLHADEDRDHQIGLKRELLDTNRDSASCLPGAEDACEELLGLIETVTAARREESRMAIDAAGRLVQEDLCVLHGESLELVAGSVCFPHGWLLANKIGLSMRSIHAPVKYYDRIADPADKVMGSLDERVRWRMNWFVVGDDRLRVEPGSKPKPPRRIHLRFERQTLRRLPVTGAIVFTIRSYLSPLETIDGRPRLQQGLLLALETMSGDERDYHGNHEPAEKAKQYLQEALQSP